MSENGDGSSPSKSRPMPISTSPSGSIRASSPFADSALRQASIARLASPIPSASIAGSAASGKRISPPSLPSSSEHQDLPAVENKASLPGPGTSALASALQEATYRFSPLLGSPPSPASPNLQYNPLLDKTSRANYDSIDAKNGRDGSDSGMGPYEDPEVVRRHLVQPHNLMETRGLIGSTNDDDEFSSLKLQGGDMTRQVYRWTEDAEAGGSGSRKHARSQSFHINRPQPESEVLDINSIMVPGGFRRDFLRRTRGSPRPYGLEAPGNPTNPAQPRFIANSFLEFLTLYGHFAGEELEEDDEALGPDEFFSSEAWEESAAVEDGEPGEDSALLPPGTPGWKKRKYKERAARATNSLTGAALLLLKSFVGTGVLFLPRAFLNGGMLFSSMVLLAVSIVSYYCFILLVNTRTKIEGSFGDIGGVLYGKHMRRIILGSIVLSQMGFVSAYIVFTSENLQAFILAVSECKTFIDIKFMILMQLIIFLPLSLVRDISKLGFTALIADVFIMLGLIYLFYYDLVTVVSQHGASDIVQFNPSTWTLFIGTAIFTYEGVGLIIPIQESMKKPQKFPAVLAGVMVAITIVFLSAGAFSYAAYGSSTKTVVILNLPQNDKFVNAVQFLYSLAILLSTPLQLFPAIRIMENELFTRSGKYNPGIKWKKNFFRFVLVMFCAFAAWGGAEDLDKFVSLIGSFACVPLVYVYPPLLHLKGCAETKRQRLTDIILACLGIIGCIYTTTLTLYNWVAGDVVTSPGYCDA